MADIKNRNVMKNKIAAAKRLIATCEKELFANEYGLMTIRGVENLSRSDVENIILYCNYFIENKTIGGLMPPRGVIADVLCKIDITKKDEWF